MRRLSIVCTTVLLVFLMGLLVGCLKQPEPAKPSPAPAPTTAPAPAPTPAPAPAQAPTSALPSAPLPTGNDTVVFPDNHLDTIIRQELGKAPGEEITKAELANLTEISRTYTHVKDLSGIEHCSNLTSIKLYRNHISDITPLASLTSLVSLNLEGNEISDISPLASLTNLESLNLRDNQISDITALSDLTNLKSLDLSVNQISDISRLALLTNLETLQLPTNQIGDISALSELTKLTNLNLGGNNLRDISHLASLTNLSRLDLRYNQLSDISPLSSLINLKRLYINANQISDISALSSMTKLEVIYLGSNRLSNIAPLASLTNLKELWLPTNQISDVSPLASLANLEVLLIDDNKISDISSLSSLTNLEGLHLSSNQISDISPLALLNNLENLYLKENLISDISPLLQNTGLGPGDGINLENNKLDLLEGSQNLDNVRQLQKRGIEVSVTMPDDPWDTPIAAETVTFPDHKLDKAIRDYLGKAPEEKITREELAGISMLTITNSDLADLSGIEYCLNLYMLDLSNNQISDISPLADLFNIGVLNLSNNRIEDISPIASLPFLLEINLGNNQISDISPLASWPFMGQQIDDELIQELVETAREQPWEVTHVSAAQYLVKLNLCNNQISDISPLTYTPMVYDLNLAGNQVSDLSPLYSMVYLMNIDLSDNQIGDISPLLQNPGIGRRDLLYLDNNRLDLSWGSEDVDDILALEEREVTVYCTLFPEPPPAPILESETYNSPGYGFSVKYPKDWEIEEDAEQNTVLFYGLISEGYKVNVNIAATSLPRDSRGILTVEEYYRIFLEPGLRRQVENFNKIEEYRTRVSGKPARVITFTFTSDKYGSEVKLKDSLALLKKEDLAYIVIYSATSQLYEQYLNSFNLALSSFKFK